MKTIIITAEDIARMVEAVGLDRLMDEMIARLAEAGRNFDATQTIVRARDGFQYTEPYVGLIEWMPVMRVGQHSTIKTVGYHPANPEHSRLPTILSTISTYDTATGHLTGLADGTFVTALRTAAASAVASRILAKPESGTLGLVGCGAQAVAHVHALLRCFPIDQLLVADIDPSAVASLPGRISRFASDIAVREAPVDLLLQSADIVCTSTTIGVGEGPLFADLDTRPWLHINAIGADFHGKTELPIELLKRSLVCPDFEGQATAEGECQQLDAADIGPDLVGLLKNEANFAEARERVTVFDSTGYALEDQVAMEMLMDLAEQHGLGSHVQLEAISADPLDPYHFDGVPGDGAIASPLKTTH